MKNVLKLYVLAFVIFTSIRREPLAEATSSGEVDEKDESNDFGMKVYILCYVHAFQYRNRKNLDYSCSENLNESSINK